MTEPTTVSPDQITDALTALKLGDTDTIRAVEITPHAVTITRYRRNADGKKFVVGNNEIATVTTVIPIKRPKPPVKVY